MESYVVLARKYRPRTFDEVLGQESIAKTLVHAIESGRVAHAYLFSGPRGVGKTSMARILARALCCQKHDAPVPDPCNECDLCRAVAKGEDLDVIEIDGASNRGIEEIRTLRENARFSPARARFKIYVIDEVHMLTTEAFNALLKILEEPPSHVKFVFATTEPQKVPATILSRCQRFDFRRIPTRTIVGHLAGIATKEGVEAPSDVLYTVAQAATGGMRDAESLLDQLITLGGGEVRAEDVTTLLGTVSTQVMEDLFLAIASGDDNRAVELFEEIYDQGVDPVEFLRQALGMARDLLVLLTCGEETDLVDATPETRAGLARIAGDWGQPRVLFSLSVFSDTLEKVKGIGEGRALVTLALVRLAKSEGLRSLDAILSDLQDLRRRIERGSPDPAPGNPRSVGSNASRRSPPTPSPAPRRDPPPPPAPSPDQKDGPALFGDVRLPLEGAMVGEESTGLSIEKVREAWSEVVERVAARSSALASFLAPGRIVNLTDSRITVGFAPGATFQASQVRDLERIGLVEESAREVFGIPLRIAVRVTDEVEEEAAPPGGDEAPPARAGDTASVSRAEVEKIQREPIVGALKEILSARLVNVERT